ncbi:hypothetical protein ACIHCQ_34060 [Streptomyces sp. NPDC052236]|uniref:hypothetical protein n=1 Tax=Streptomyces sp. NPDC052236 TaxID=3365686 RepID=UPI0037CD768C
MTARVPPRLICVAGEFTRYDVHDVHAVREHRRSIDLVRYCFFGNDHFGLETVASVVARTAVSVLPDAPLLSRCRVGAGRRE